MRKRIIIVACICVVFGLIFYMFKGSGMEIEVARVDRGYVSKFISEDGKTRLSKTYTFNMPVDGRLLRIDLDVGDYVEKGQVVARIDPYQMRQELAGLKAQLDEISALIIGVDQAKPKPEDIEAARLRVEASRLRLENAGKELEIARINLERRSRDYDRMKGLWKEKALSESSYDEAEQIYKSASERMEQADIQKKVASRELEVDGTNYRRILNSADDNEYQRGVYNAQRQRIKTEINITEDRLAKTEIISPVSGPVMEKFIEDEQVLPPGTPILTIGDLSSIEIEADILSEEIGEVRVGQDVEVSGKAIGGKNVYGKIKTIYPSGFKKISSLGIEQQRVKTLMEFDNSGAGIRPGVSVDVRIIVAKNPNALRIPEKSVFRLSDGWAVFVLKGKRVYLQAISTGLRNTEHVEIMDGLAEGQAFVLLPPNGLEPGMKIKPVFR
ncbi:efflux RND transporter periplasmic adaptor subunit [bacterium]|nr:efflux RND transporter periplasmic adaptor subunit [bacterium]